MNFRWIFHGTSLLLGALVVLFKYAALWPVAVLGLLFGAAFFVSGLIKRTDDYY